MADEKKSDEPTVPDATPAEVQDALKKGKNVIVEMPDHITSVSHEGSEYVAEADGYFHMFIKHALHAVEAFGGRIVSEVRKLEPNKLKK